MRHLLKIFAISFTLMLYYPQTFAQSFEAEFAVRVMGFNIGTVYQNMKCEDENCVLTSEANPPRWARRFINESTLETIHLTINDQAFQWHRYHKDLERRYSDRTVNIEVDLIAQPEQDKIIFPQREREWPYSPYAYDLISLAYALQYYAKTDSLPDFILQEEKQQTAVEFSRKNHATRTHLNYQSNADARLFEWTTPTLEVKVWLIESLDLFPGKIEVFNKEHNRRILLTLDRQPKLRD